MGGWKRDPDVDEQVIAADDYRDHAALEDLEATLWRRREEERMRVGD